MHFKVFEEFSQVFLRKYFSGVSHYKKTENDAGLSLARPKRKGKSCSKSNANTLQFCVFM